MSTYVSLATLRAASPSTMGYEDYAVLQLRWINQNLRAAGHRAFMGIREFRRYLRESETGREYREWLDYVDEECRYLRAIDEF